MSGRVLTIANFPGGAPRAPVTDAGFEVPLATSSLPVYVLDVGAERSLSGADDAVQTLILITIL